MDRGGMPRPEQNNLKESRGPEPERSGAPDVATGNDQRGDRGRDDIHRRDMQHHMGREMTEIVNQKHRRPSQENGSGARDGGTGHPDIQRPGLSPATGIKASSPSSQRCSPSALLAQDGI